MFIPKKQSHSLALVSASSRFNFGDVLYAVLGEKIFPNSIHVNLSGRRLDDFNTPSHPIRNTAIEKAIFLGGELFPKPYYQLWKSENYLRYQFEKSKAFITEDPGSGFFTSAKYNYAIAVGMQRISQKYPYDIKKLKNFSFLGVRDSISYSNARQAGLNPVLVPDLAFLTSEIFTTPYVKKNTMVVHLNRFYLSKHLDSAAEMINRYCRDLKLQAVIQNMASCRNHDSIKLSKKLASLVGGSFHKAAGVSEIIKTIAESSAYLGNSFHGGIVSLSYGNPVVMVNSHGNKIVNLSNDINVPCISSVSQALPEPRKIEITAFKGRLKSILSAIQSEIK